MTDALVREAALRSTVMRMGGLLRVGMLLTLVLLLGSFVSLIWTPHALDRVDVTARLLPPSLAHPFGTDPSGRDVLSMTMKAALTSYVVAAVGTAVAFFGGTALGVLSAVAGRRAWQVTGGMGVFISAAPALAIAALITTRWGPGAVNAMLAIGLAGMPLFIRLAHDAVDRSLADGAVAATRLSGMSWGEALRLHAVPGLVGRVLILATAYMAIAAPLEATLAYMGLGAQPGSMSIGVMLREAQSYLTFAPQLAIAPGLILALASFGLLLISDGLRHDLKPHMRDELDALA